MQNAQHGFKVRCLIVKNLLIAEKYLAKWINEGDDFDSLSFNLTKAFDQVHHGALLQRLQHLQFHCNFTKWFIGY